MNTPGYKTFAWRFALGLTCLLLAGVSLAQRDRFNAAPPQPAQLAPAQQPTQPSSQGLTPADDWIGAIIRGGTVILGAGEFTLNNSLELVNPVTVIGQGMEATTIVLNSSDS